MFSKRSIFTTIGLIAVVGITNYISLKSLRSTYHRPKGLYVTGIADKVQVIQMNNIGQPDYTAKADKVIRYSDGRSRLFNVNSTDYQAQKAPWRLTAHNGWAYPGSTQIHLWGDVNIWRPKSAEQQPVHLQTEALTYFPHKDFATTKAAVRIFEPGTQTVTTAVGMNAHPKAQTVQLLSKVHSIYEAPTAHTNHTGH